MARKQVHRLIFLITALSIVVSMPFSIKWCSWSIALLTINWLIEGKWEIKWVKLKSTPIIWLFVAFYLSNVFGLLYTSDLDNGLFHLEKKLALLILPLVIGTSEPFKRKELLNVFNFFIASCVLAVIISVTLPFFQDPVSNAHLINFDVFNAAKYDALFSNPAEFWSRISYIGLGSALGLHPTYFSLYLVFSIILITTIHLKSFKSFKLWSKILITLSLSILTLGLILLSSRIVILSFSLLSVSWLFLYFSSKRYYLRGVLSCFAFGAVIFFLLYINPVSRFRVIEEPIHSGLKYPEVSNNWNSWNLRLVEWNSSLKVIKENPMLGVGTGDGPEALFEKYAAINLGHFDLGYNSHNQFLQTGVVLGIIGTVLFLITIIWPVSTSLKFNNRLYLSFIFLFCMCCLTESMLERQKGIVFYGFFSSLLLFHSNTSKAVTYA